MVLKLYGTSEAGSGTSIVALVLAEKQIPFEHIAVDLGAQEQKTPEFLAMHPFGQVPVIDDDGFILYESRAICRYLAEKYADQGTQLLPKTLEGRALVEQAASVELANFNPVLVRAGKEVFRQRRRNVPDRTLIAEVMAGLEAKLDVYEVILGKHNFLAGDEFTLADLFHLSYVVWIELSGIDVMTSRGPNVKRWWTELVSRPEWVKMVAEGIKGTVN
ncbi:glutathione S-transferase [Mycena metata]|uniref:glutathione transferase n=1 Tax=Mycena metata TaxID=1033252 RepID=A0AAD7HVE5_9AGAR|nr:glutathione S-transferase [Mycena metata]